MIETIETNALNHHHVWESRWWAFDRTHKWRQCVYPNCHAYQKQDVSTMGSE